MKTPIFEGSSVAIVTPFKEGKVNYDKFTELVEWHVSSGTAAITVCGTTGESATLTESEHDQLVKHCVKIVNGRIKVIAGTGSNNTERALLLSKKAEDAGVDGLLVVTPYYNKTTQAGLVKHYTYLADRVRTPIIVYSVPSRTGLKASIETLKILSDHPMINGLKDANNNISQLVGTMAVCGDNLNIWSGSDDETVPMMAMGAKGVISVWANIEPTKVAQMSQAALQGDFVTAARIQKDAYRLIKALFSETNPIPVKQAMNLIGKDVGYCRMPLCEMSSDNVANLKKTLFERGL